MTDALLWRGRDIDDWYLDINIVDGYAELVMEPQIANTVSQRKAVLAFQIQQSIPGDWDRGVDWPNIIASAGNMPLAEAMMQVQSAVDGDSGISASQSFSVPILQLHEDGIQVQILTVTPDDLKENTYG